MLIDIKKDDLESINYVKERYKKGEMIYKCYGDLIDLTNNISNRVIMYIFKDDIRVHICTNSELVLYLAVKIEHSDKLFFTDCTSFFVDCDFYKQERLYSVLFEVVDEYFIIGEYNIHGIILKSYLISNKSPSYNKIISINNINLINSTIYNE